MTEYCKFTRSDNSENIFKFTKLINDCLDQVLSSPPDLNSFVLTMDGMSGRLYRHWINLLVKQIENPRYLEIGAWHGSTFCSAIVDNTIKASVVDNWSQFEGSRKNFEHNLSKIIGENSVNIIEADFRTVNWTDQPIHNIYMFDGPHLKQDQYDGIAMILPALDDQFVLIVDDWNNRDVQEGTKSALNECGLSYSYVAIETTEDGSHPHQCRQNSNWHNGYFFASVKKNTQKKI
jgi:hypothetical protein